MQTCSRCEQPKEPEEFSTRKGRKQPWCKDCNKAYARQYYRDNQPKLKQDIIRLKLARMAANKHYLVDYLLAHPCIDCGETDPVVLEFDHVRGKKKDVISTLITQGYSIKAIAEEIGKCEVVCANCHRRRTAYRAGYYKTKMT